MRARRHGFGALIVGYYADDTLCYAGKVGTGFSDSIRSTSSIGLGVVHLDEQPLVVAKERVSA